METMSLELRRKKGVVTTMLLDGTVVIEVLGWSDQSKRIFKSITGKGERQSSENPPAGRELVNETGKGDYMFWGENFGDKL